MQKKVWVGLEEMEFYAYHGVYAKEREQGGKYIVDVFVETNATKALVEDDLLGTINYELIFDATQKNMNTPVNLIEHLAKKILDDLRLFIPKENKIRLKIRKIQPPLDGKVGASSIEIED